MLVEIENIAGITEGSAEVHDGVNTIQASNWKGKSSFIRSIETAFGTKKPLTEGKEEGRVTVRRDGEETEVRLVRKGRSVVRRGDPVLDDEHDRLLVDLFAFLGEDNEVRRAVRNGEDLKEVLTRPLEIEDIDSRIAELTRERESVEKELQRAEEKANDLVRLEQRKTELESELETLREKQTEYENEVSSEDREQLGDLRAERKRVNELIEQLESSIERSREKLEELYDEYDEIEVSDPEGIEAEIAEVREQYEQAEQDKELLQSVYSANKRLLEEDRLDLLSDVEHGLIEDEHTCWLCGGETTREEMKANLDEVGDRVLDLREEVQAHENRIEELEAERSEIKRQRRKKQDLDEQISDLKSNISERSESLSSARERREIVEEKLERLSDEVEETDEELSDVQSEIKYREAELEDVEEELEAASRAADRVDTLEEELEALSEEIADLRTRREEIQSRIRSEFDAAIQEIVPLFETSFESARLTSEFELIVARDGREASLDALSEGEVELLGLITAVAGFEAYDVAERTPVILLDQLGGLADDNLATLAEYLEGRTRSLVLTAYPENSTFGGTRIDPSDWDVIPPAEATAT